MVEDKWVNINDCDHPAKKLQLKKVDKAMDGFGNNIYMITMKCFECKEKMSWDKPRKRKSKNQKRNQIKIEKYQKNNWHSLKRIIHVFNIWIGRKPKFKDRVDCAYCGKIVTDEFELLDCFKCKYCKKEFCDSECWEEHEEYCEDKTIEN